MSPPNAITSSRLAREEKKKLGDDIELVENLRVNKRHWLEKFNKISQVPQRGNDSGCNYRKYIETREIIKEKERKCLS